MNENIVVRPFAPSDAQAVTDLFVAVNRQLAPQHLTEAFEVYIEDSIAAEIGRIAEYYRDKKGQFRVVTAGSELVGMFGLEPYGSDAMELRRMYVDPAWRRRGIAGKMLRVAEDDCRRLGLARLELSTSEIQGDALSFYRRSGYRPDREEIVNTASNKTIGGGIRRFYFSKMLQSEEAQGAGSEPPGTR